MLQFPDPLLDEVRWAKHRETIDFPAVHQFAKDQTRLDRLPDPDIIGDQETGHLQAKRHQQGDELIGSGLESQLRGRTERAGPPSKCEPHRIREERCLRLDSRQGIGGQVETGCGNRLGFKRRVKDDRVALAAGKRA